MIFLVIMAAILNVLGLLSLIPWALGFWLVGLLLFFGTPLTIGPKLPRSWRTKLCGPYTRMAMKLSGRALLASRSPGASFTPMDRDGETGEKFTLDGENRHVEDDANVLGRWRGQPFGLAHPSKATVYDASLCAIGPREEAKVTSGKHQTDGGFETDVGVPSDFEFVPFDGALPIIPKDADTRSVDRTDTFVEHALRKFGSRVNAQHIILLMTLGGSFLLVVGTQRYILDGAGGGPSTTLPMLVPWEVFL